MKAHLSLAGVSLDNPTATEYIHRLPTKAVDFGEN